MDAAGRLNGQNFLAVLAKLMLVSAGLKYIVPDADSEL